MKAVFQVVGSKRPEIKPTDSFEESKDVIQMFWNIPGNHDSLFIENEPLSIHFTMPNYYGHTWH